MVSALWDQARVTEMYEIAQRHLDAYAEKKLEENRITVWCEEEERKKAEFARVVVEAVMKHYSAPPATAGSSQMDTANSDADFAGALY